ncbi:MAG TPA: Plug domain-containing protein [Gemmatimonadales bacterium]|nr:Plug domain-containing protein [Gemmatimonadales bacterium]
MTRLPLFAVLLAGSSLAAACGHTTSAAREDVMIAPDGRRIITEKAIEQSGARTAWDALQRTVPFFNFNDGTRGRPARVEHRGRSSILLRDQPLILVDGVELNDFTLLGGIPADDLFEIEVLTGIDATTYYGTNATKGVIRIWTKSGAT